MKQLEELTEWGGLSMVYPQSYSPHTEPKIEFSQENFEKLIDSHNQLISAVNELIARATN